MPHIEIKCYPGRTEEVKKACAERVADVVAQSMGCDISAVSVSIAEVAREDWKSEVWDKQIEGNPELYVNPGYIPE